MPADSADQQKREQLIGRLNHSATEGWDIVIIGGGAVGLGVGLDAVTRGYRTLLLEQHDFCKGTSSRSTKLIHGGVRYLRQGNISLVREALHERSLLLRNAPTIVKPLRFLIPCFSAAERWYYALGMKCYDAMAGRLRIGRSHQLSTSQFCEELPAIRPAGLRGGVVYHDAQFDDARLAIAMAQTLVAQGGVALNYMRVDAVRSWQGRVRGVRVADEETGDSHEIDARAVINATGVFSDHIRRLEDAGAANLVSPSQGIHLVVDRRFLGGDDALMIPKTKDGRVLFAIPWLGRVVLGTTDTPVDQVALEPKPRDSEVDYLLDHLARYLDPAPTRDDVRSAFAGLRPLVRPLRDVRSTASISRDHRIVVSEGGLISILGGKWTTYRRMAEEVVEKAIAVAELSWRPSRTSDLRVDAVPGASRQEDTAGAMCAPTPDDVRDAVRLRFARTVEDVLARRHRCLFLDAAGSVKLARDVAKVMAADLQRGPEWMEKQVSSYAQLAASYALQDPESSRGR